MECKVCQKDHPFICINCLAEILDAIRIIKEERNVFKLRRAIRRLDRLGVQINETTQEIKVKDNEMQQL